VIALMRPEEQLKALHALYAWANEIGANGPAVEVGTFSGENAVVMTKYFNSVVTVDPWRNGYDKDDHASNADMAEVEKKYFERIKDLKNISHLKLTSLEGANEFEDASLDFVYLDGDHQTDAVVADIDAWKPKIRKGGILAGHDINMDKVHNALKQRLNGVAARLFKDSSWGIII
jgi:predicted O-methyltransferase YrrM